MLFLQPAVHLGKIKYFVVKCGLKAWLTCKVEAQYVISTYYKDSTTRNYILTSPKSTDRPVSTIDMASIE